VGLRQALRPLRGARSARSAAGGQLPRRRRDGHQLTGAVDADQLERGLDEDLAVGLAVSLLVERDAILALEAAGAPDLDDLAEGGAVLEHHRGLVDDETDSLFAPQPRELLRAQHVLARALEVTEVVRMVDEPGEVGVLVVDLHVEELKGAAHATTMP